MRARIRLILAGALLILLAWLASEYSKVLQEPVVHHTLVVEIEKGDSFHKITQKLVEKGVEINPLWFRFIALQKKTLNKLKAGEYELIPGLTTTQLLTQFAEGRAKKYEITFLEGWTLKELVQQIENNPYLTKTVPRLSSAEIAAQLKLTETNPEGLFFPDTYFFEKKATDISILKRAYDKMQHVLQQEWQSKSPELPYKSSYEALIMASIVEKETGAINERNRIAGVFVRRLKKSMLLQTDPTVIYGMGEKYKGNIRTGDLTAPTPYNTYVITGLPPTPIAMPGQSAIHAALHPDNENSLYFVSKGDGSHQFSATLAEHNSAVNSYQKHKK